LETQPEKKKRPVIDDESVVAESEDEDEEEDEEGDEDNEVSETEEGGKALRKNRDINDRSDEDSHNG